MAVAIAARYPSPTMAPDLLPGATCLRYIDLNNSRARAACQFLEQMRSMFVEARKTDTSLALPRFKFFRESVYPNTKVNWFGELEPSFPVLYRYVLMVMDPEYMPGAILESAMTTTPLAKKETQDVKESKDSTTTASGKDVAPEKKKTTKQTTVFPTLTAYVSAADNLMSDDRRMYSSCLEQIQSRPLDDFTNPMNPLSLLRLERAVRQAHECIVPIQTNMLEYFRMMDTTPHFGFPIPSCVYEFNDDECDSAKFWLLPLLPKSAGTDGSEEEEKEVDGKQASAAAAADSGFDKSSGRSYGYGITPSVSMIRASNRSRGRSAGRIGKGVCCGVGERWMFAHTTGARNEIQFTFCDNPPCMARADHKLDAHTAAQTRAYQESSRAAMEKAQSDYVASLEATRIAEKKQQSPFVFVLQAAATVSAAESSGASGSGSGSSTSAMETSDALSMPISADESAPAHDKGASAMAVDD